MVLSDVSIKRPVFATVISLMLVVLGLASISKLPIREYDNAVKTPRGLASASKVSKPRSRTARPGCFETSSCKRWLAKGRTGPSR